jgi:hypothetical protein
MGTEGQEKENYRHWTLPALKDFATQIQEWFQGGKSSKGPEGLNLSLGIFVTY